MTVALPHHAMVPRTGMDYGSAKNRSMTGVHAPRVIDDHRRTMDANHRLMGDHHGLGSHDDGGMPLRHPLGVGVGCDDQEEKCCGNEKSCSASDHLCRLRMVSSLPQVAIFSSLVAAASREH